MTKPTKNMALTDLPQTTQKKGAKDYKFHGNITLNTWGTNYNGNGILNSMDYLLFGGNMGHASLAITIPADEVGIELIKKYCLIGKEKLIPFERHSQIVRDKFGQPKTIDVFTIYFSWWPSKNPLIFELPHSLNADGSLERPGTDVGELDPRFQSAGISQETRTYRGRLGSKEMALHPHQIVHVRNLKQPQLDILEIDRRILMVDSDLQGLERLLSKLVIKSEADKSAKSTNSIEITDSLRKLLNKYIPEWEPSLSNMNSLDTHSVSTLQNYFVSMIKSMRAEKLALENEKHDLQQQLRPKSRSPFISENFSQNTNNSGLEKTSDPFTTGSYEGFVTQGKPPDNSINLPLGGVLENAALNKGLNVEKMLKKMKSIATSNQYYDIRSNNCADAVGSILEAGSVPELSSYFQEKPLGVYRTPQNVLNGAARYQKTLLQDNGKQSLLDRLAPYNPLNAVTASARKVFSAYTNPKNSALTKAALTLPLIGMGILAGAATSLKSFSNPKNAFNRCEEFISYASKNSSLVLKAAIIPVAAVAVVFSIPALFQEGFSQIGKQVKKISTKPNAPKPPSRNTAPHSTKLHEVEIDELDPLIALQKMHHVIETEREALPILSNKTQKKVASYLNQLNKTKVEDANIISTYERDAQIIYKRLRSNN